MKYGKSSGPERQARLKPQFAALYPGVVAGEWMPAWVLAEQLLARAEEQGVSPRKRVCLPTHIEFRGGGPRPPELRGLRTRATDAGDSGGGGGGSATNHSRA
jgi:hypothetical protein